MSIFSAFCRFAVVLFLTISTTAFAEDAPPPQGPPPAMVTVEKVAPADAAFSFEYVGQVAGSREVDIRARVTGIIEERLYKEGAFVEQGTPLFRIEPAPFKAALAESEARVAQAKAGLTQAKREYKRLKPLSKSGAASKKEIDDAESAHALAKAALMLAEAQQDTAKINLEYTNVTAPISGYAGRASKKQGALADAMADSLLTTMAQTDQVHVDFAIPEGAYLKLRRDMAAGNVILPKEGYLVELKTSDGQDLPHEGRVEFIDYKADRSTGSFAMRATIDNKDGVLAPGQFVRVVLTGMTRPNVITVPQAAVLDGPMGKYVYVMSQAEQGTIALQKPVVVGPWVEGNRWVIDSGLQKGDAVIIEGMARIFFPGASVMPAPDSGAKSNSSEAPAMPPPKGME